GPRLLRRLAPPPGLRGGARRLHARRSPCAAERAAEGANEADGPLSSLQEWHAGGGGDLEADALARTGARRSGPGHAEEEPAAVELHLIVDGVAEVAGAAHRSPERI